MTVKALRAMVNKIQTTWRQVTALVLFRSVVLKAMKMTDYMLNKHQPVEMKEYRHCLNEYSRVCMQLVAVHNSQKVAANDLRHVTDKNVEVESFHFDSELTALQNEFEQKLRQLTSDINTKCNHPKQMQKWLQNQQIDAELKPHQMIPSMALDCQLFDDYMSTLHRLADEYKAERKQIKQWRKRSENVMYSRLHNRIDVMMQNKSVEIEYLELEKNKWDKKYRVMRDVTGYYRNCWLHYMATDNKLDREQIEKEMTDKEILYQIYQNVLSSHDIEEERKKERMIRSKYKKKESKEEKTDRVVFNYQSPKRMKIAEKKSNIHQTQAIVDQMRKRQTPRILETDIVVPLKLQKFVRCNSFFQNINDLAALGRFEDEHLNNDSA